MVADIQQRAVAFVLLLHRGPSGPPASLTTQPRAKQRTSRVTITNGRVKCYFTFMPIDYLSHSQPSAGSRVVLQKSLPFMRFICDFEGDWLFGSRAL